MGRRTSIQLGRLAAALALGLLCACSGPVAASPMAGASPILRALPDLKFSTCTNDGCVFEGTLVNDGPGCARNVTGVTHLLDADGKELEARPWTLDGRVRPRVQTPFGGCCFSSKAVGSYKRSRTEVSAEPLECI